MVSPKTARVGKRWGYGLLDTCRQIRYIDIADVRCLQFANIESQCDLHNSHGCEEELPVMWRELNIKGLASISVRQEVTKRSMQWPDCGVLLCDIAQQRPQGMDD